MHIQSHKLKVLYSTWMASPAVRETACVASFTYHLLKVRRSVFSTFLELTYFFLLRRSSLVVSSCSGETSSQSQKLEMDAIRPSNVWMGVEGEERSRALLRVLGWLGIGSPFPAPAPPRALRFFPPRVHHTSCGSSLGLLIPQGWK